MKVWVDGCFDMFHYGHANALRQARHHGDQLIVGVHTDADILAHKGPCLMSQEERYFAVAACRFVDAVVPGAPYVTDVGVMREWGCGVCVHGDDTVTGADGQDVYAAVKEAGMYREVNRTPSVSTTDLLGRILGTRPTVPSAGINLRQITQFAADCQLPPPTGTIVYIDGTFDMVHVGHLAALQAARNHGDHLIVGVHDDATVNQWCRRQPVMTMEERVLGLLACRWVDNVIIGAPFRPDREFLERHRIDVVCVGSVFEYKTADMDCYAVPSALGILKQLPPHPHHHLTVDAILRRVVGRRGEYVERNARKAVKDAAMMARGFV